MDEIGRQNAAGLGDEKLLPGRPGPARCGIDSGGVQNLPP
jgi:hypothetical protein